MAEAVTLLIFVFMLLGCVMTDISVIYALIGGLFCFSIYTLYNKYSLSQLGAMLWKGVKGSRTILVVFVLIGALTAVWRASGTIPFIVYYSVSFMEPRYYLALTFLLCCGMSALTGTSFGTASTMGVICAGVGRALNVPAVYIGGAVMSGIYFGEQCSPLSSSALLVCELTGTNIYTMITKVFRQILVPFVVALIVYLYLGNSWETMSIIVDSAEIFENAFSLKLITLLPAGIIIIFSIFRVRVELTMLISIIIAMVICVVYQNMEITQVLKVMVYGYHVKEPQLAALINGGGLISMIDIGIIVAISSAFFGIFSMTNLLFNLKKWIARLEQRSNIPFMMVVVSFLTCAISCNQTLATMLTCEMTKSLIKEKENLALYLEMSVIVIAGLVPWSIACAFPLSVVEAPIESLRYAVYLYLVPLWLFLKRLLLECPEGKIR